MRISLPENLYLSVEVATESDGYVAIHLGNEVIVRALTITMRAHEARVLGQRLLDVAHDTHHAEKIRARAHSGAKR